MIKNIFIHKVDREIETVVKANDLRYVDNEIEEYVITHEISRKIADLFAIYGKSNTINGVWIHGFFGSGKSHLLKMLSYVLGNRKMENGKLAAEVFASKAKDEILKGDILRAAKIPSESILFNIDQQATISSKEKGDSVLSVFYKVFYDHLGFYGTQSHIAEFEWWLTYSKKIYKEFKEKFETLTGRLWEEARRDYFDLDVTDAISEVLGELFQKGATDYETILEDIEEKHELSIQNFAERVAEYIENKPKGFQLNFFIDEVGQFIAGERSLMLNLQTIAESLGTTTHNKAWIFATAQSAIEGLGKDIKKSQDYSTILGRFRTQINLTSANVDEVIEKRLLEKKEQFLPELKTIYEENKSLIKTLISTSEQGMPITSYKGERDFIHKYPFLFYQFSLFQECRISLANHDVFQGKHASVGERSMLGVFQEVLKVVQDDELLTLVSFDKMYDGLEKGLRAEFVKSINNAQQNLGDEYALKVFKTLFLVKYYKQFLTTKENIAMLLIDHINIDIKAHQDKVYSALNLLERHSYIERNGDLYEFLTNKEKDIESDIKNTAIDESKVNQTLKELFYDEVLGKYSKRIRFEDNKQDYEFTQKLDGGIFGREKEMSIEIITPNYSGVDDLEILKNQTVGLPLLRLVTPADEKFIEDVRFYLKVQSYYSKNQTSANSSEVRSILYQKAADNQKRKISLKSQANQLLGSAKAFVHGSQLDILPKNSGQDYVVECFQSLIKKTYPNLRMLGETTYTEDTFKKVIQGFNVPGFFDKGDASVTDAGNQILVFIRRRKNQKERTSIYDIKNHFIKAPYGWYENATFSLLGRLYKKNKIEVTVQESLLDDDQLIDVLLNASQHSRAFVDSQTEYNPGQIQEIKALFKDLFDQNTVYNDPKDIGIDFKNKLRDLVTDVQNLLSQKTDYPFVVALQPFYDNMKKWTLRNYKDFIENAIELDELLVDDKIDKYDEIKSFIKGTQGDIYKNIAQTVKGQTANFDYVEGTEFESLKEFLAHESPYRGNALQNAEAQRKSLQDKVISLIEEERNLTKTKFEKAIQELEEHEVMKKLEKVDFDSMLYTIKKKLTEIPKQQFIGNLRDERRGLSSLVEVALNRALEIITPSKTSSGSSGSGPQEPAYKYVNQSQINVPFEKAELITEEDVKEYAEKLKETFLKRIKENKRIRL